MERNFKSLQNQLDIIQALELQSKWEKQSDNPELKKLGECLVRIAFYINSLELEQYSYNRVVSELIADKGRAVMRARKSESETDKINERLKTKESVTNKLKKHNAKSNAKPNF
jgi:hypothetical protein